MANALIVINDDKERQRVLDYVKAAPIGTRVNLKGPARTLPQNDRLWAMLTDIVRQRKNIINSRVLTTDELKVVFMHALGQEHDVLPTLDGRSFFSTGYRSSSMTKEQMSALIEYMFAWGAENNIRWSDPNLRSQEEMMR